MEQQTKRQLAEEWLKYAVQNWQSNLKRMRIKSSGDLYNSFKTQIIEQAGGDKIKITIAYAWYGQMVDMGVGKGTKYGDVKDSTESRKLIGKMRGNARRPKKWWSNRRDAIGYQAFKLTLLMSGYKAQEATEKIKGSIDQNFTITY
ncbi:hypothetical protein [Pontibacter beigongshangensis]|uniref:hypothetical protein n=1 Tax=Pontibacter beigongshangensis TaxID=2574733 RepID=UPI00164F91D5|nr:hypothetical protein [Pontibacter beigongshangensis]